ncbi:MAG: RDD family protein [Acidimicrobiia bacterium]|nr:RDD family protein [Acidimicrobiia bacterium]
MDTLDDRMTISTPEGVDFEVTLAGVGSRFMASLLDGLILYGAIFALLIVTGFLAMASAGAAVALLAITALLVLFGYHAVFETLNAGRSPGKAAAGIRVVRLGGGRVTFLSAMARNLLWPIEVLALAPIAVVSVLVGRRNQRLGDHIAGTVVVRDRKAPVVPAAVLLPAAYAPDAPFLRWDVSTLGPDELAAVRRFLERRATLPPGARAGLARELAARLGPRVAGAPPDWHPEAFLEGVVAAKAARA